MVIRIRGGFTDGRVVLGFGLSMSFSMCASSAAALKSSKRRAASFSALIKKGKY